MHKLFALRRHQFFSLQTIDAATDLAKLAASGHLSLFLGAGTSIASGLPSWIGLLNAIEDKFTPSGATHERYIGKACCWDPLTMADELEQLAAHAQTGMEFIAHSKPVFPTLSRKCNANLLLCWHSSFAAFQVYYVTTNYDRQIETGVAKKS
jgi:hypothetical protein